MHRRFHTTVVHSTLACTIALLAACTHTPPAAAPTPPPSVTTTTAQHWFDDVRSIAQGGDNAGRRAAIGQRLDAAGLAWRASAFEIDKLKGENLLADVGGRADAPLLLLGAHSDRVDHGIGATDNASGSATVIELAKRLKAKPLRNHRVAIAFWDLEERGLLGSKAYIRDGGSKPALYVNFDVFGWGDTLWMMAPPQSQALSQASQASAQAMQLQFSGGEHYPPTDHLPFLKAGWPAVSYSLVGADEITLILDMYAGKKLKTPPKVMRVIHSDADTMDQVDAEAAARGVDAVEQALRAWDAAAN